MPLRLRRVARGPVMLGQSLVRLAIGRADPGDGAIPANRLLRKAQLPQAIGNGSAFLNVLGIAGKLQAGMRDPLEDRQQFPRAVDVLLRFLGLPGLG
jgi:hypothetical protein